MLIVRDTSRNGVAVSWGTDHPRMHEIADGNAAFEVVPDLAASRYYWNVERDGMAWVHPYDLSAQRDAEIKP